MSRRGALWALGTPVRLALLGLIGAYRVTVGQLAGGRCRFHPSCSAYAWQAVGELGAVRGAALAAWRVLRCGPWTAGGVEYPPTYEDVIHLRQLPAVMYDKVIRMARRAPSGAGEASA
jgi:uncharacterized protein